MASEERRFFRTVQQEVASCNPEPYYSVYRKHEARYWRDIAYWLYNLPSLEYPTLDVGCGYGAMMTFCKMKFGTDAYGLDIHPWVSRELLAKFGLRCSLACDIEVDPLQWEREFSLITMIEVLEHFRYRPEPTLVKLVSRLSDNGVLMISTPNRPRWDSRGNYGIYKSLDEVPFQAPDSKLPAPATALFTHYFLYTKEDLEQLISALGLRLEHLTGDDNYHYNVMARKVVEV